MEIQDKEIDFEDSSWKIIEASDGGLEITHSGTGETYTFADTGELTASSVTAQVLTGVDIDAGTLVSALDAAGYDISNVGNIYIGQVSTTPTDTEIGTGNTAFYAKDDGNLYKKPYGGVEERVGIDGEWAEDGAGNIVPKDGETIGDGTTSANHQSVHTDEQTLGGTGPVTGLFGDENEWVPLHPFGNYTYGNSTTSTTYEITHSGARRFVIDTSMFPSITGIDNYGVMLWVSKLGNDTGGETTYARLRDNANSTPYNETEITNTELAGSGGYSSVEALQDSPPNGFELQMKVTGGTGSVDYFKAILMGQIA